MICSNMENKNTQKDLNDNLNLLLQQLDSLEAVPGLQIESSTNRKTPDRVKMEEVEGEEEEEEDGNPDMHDVVLKKEAQGEFA